MTDIESVSNVGEKELKLITKMKITFDDDALKKLGGVDTVRKGVELLRATTRTQCFGTLFVGSEKGCALGIMKEGLPGGSEDPTPVGSPFHTIRKSFFQYENKLLGRVSTGGLLRLNDDFQLSFSVIADILEAVLLGKKSYDIDSLF